MKHFHTLSRLLFIVLFAIAPGLLQAQPLSGTYTIGGTSPNYTTLSAAITALNTFGVNGPVVFNIRDGNYSGTSWIGQINNVSGASASNTITFQSQNGSSAVCTLSASGTSSANYIFMLNNAKYIKIKNLTLSNTGSSYGTDIMFAGAASYNLVEGCVLTGNTSSSTSTNKSRVYGTSLSSAVNDTFRNNTIDRGSYGIYFRGNSSISATYGHVFDGNTFDENHYYSLYAYYLGDPEFTNNKINRTGSGTYYGVLFYYTRDNILVDNNEFEIDKSGTTYGLQVEYSNYSSNNSSARAWCTNNKINVKSTTSSTYPIDSRYWRYGYIANNEITLNSSSTSGNIYNYVLYYGYNSKAYNNTVTVNKAGGYVRNYFSYYGSTDTSEANTVNVTGNCYIYNYMTYNTQNYYVVDNDISLKNSSRTIYGTYVYGYSGIFARNKIYNESGTGTVYGLYIDYANGAKIFNNTITTKTNSTNYGIRAYYVYPTTRLFNNTVYTEGSSSNRYNLYLYNSSSSYGLKAYNNIFYLPGGSNGYNCYLRSATNVENDYNLYYKSSGDMFLTPSQNESTLHAWRSASGLDINSLAYDVPFVDAANGDYSIDASSADAWAVNGRGVHDTLRSDDIVGVSCPRFVEDGVPDLGAYEVVPTSTPPNAVAVPANPVANSTQVFTFGQDTVATIDWGATVPTTYTVRQYTGLQVNPVPAGLARMYFYVAGTPSSWAHAHTANIRYKDPWIGDIPGEGEAVLARSSNGGAWEGYNYNNAATDELNNILSTTMLLDSVGSYTGVQNGRIGIRCVIEPTGLKVSNITAFSADLDWDAIFNPLGYQVVVKANATPPTPAEWAAAPFPATNSIAAAGLTEDTKYYVFLRNVCGLKDTSAYTLDSFVTLITCHAPVITVTDIVSDRAVVSWDTVKTAVKYEYALTTSSTPPPAGTVVYKTQQLVPFLDAKKTYYAHVRANCNSIYDKSEWSTAEFSTAGVNVNSINGSNDNSLVLYPNPAGDYLHIKIGGSSQSGTIDIVNVTGAVLINAEVSSASNTIDVSALPTGVYMLTYTAADGESYKVKFTKI